MQQCRFNRPCLPTMVTCRCTALKFIDKALGNNNREISKSYQEWVMEFASLWLDVVVVNMWVPDCKQILHVHVSTPECCYASWVNLHVTQQSPKSCNTARILLQKVHTKYTSDSDTSWRQRKWLPPCPLVIALVPLKCSSRELQFPHRVPFTK